MPENRNRKHQPLSASDLLIEEPEARDKEELIRILQEFANRNVYKTITRDFFRNASLVPEREWTRVFGSFATYLEAAGLKTPTQVKKIENKIARHARLDDIRRLGEQRLSWGTRYVKPGNGERFKTILVASDFHDVECDPFSLRMFYRAVEQIQPDVICINGDLFDFPEFSKYTNDPRSWNMTERLTKGLEIIETIRNLAPNSQIDVIEGNHEARLQQHLLTESPGTLNLLREFHGMDMQKILRLDEYEVNYIATADLHTFNESQLKAQIRAAEKVYWGTLLARHHPPVKKHPVDMPGFSGHHHCHQVTTHWTRRMGSFEWHQTGGMHKRQASYTEGRIWNCGFLYATVDTMYQRANFSYTFVGDTTCQFGGEFHERQADEYYPALNADLEHFQQE